MASKSVDLVDMQFWIEPKKFQDAWIFCYTYFDSQAKIGFVELKKIMKIFVNSGFMKTCDEQVNRA